MPKINSKINQYISEFGKNIFSTDGIILFCKVCETKVGVDRRFIVLQHLKTEKHKLAVKRQQDRINSTSQQSQQLVFTSMHSKKSTFNHDLCKALLSANIPLNKLSNSSFRNFLTKYTGKEVPRESTLRKGYVDEIYKNTINKIRNYVDGKKIWVSIDETTDVTGRYVANVIVGTLEENNYGKQFLLHVEEMEKANHTTIFKLFDKSMNILWPEGVRHDDVLLFLSDAAPYMVKSGDAIKNLYSKIIHVTCLAHAFHRVAETVRINNPKIDKIIANVKKVFRKAPSRIQVFKNMAPTLTLPPEPILTRWGTWIEASLYYCEHFELIQSILNSFDENDAVSIKMAQKYIGQKNIKNQLVFIKSNFAFLPNTITSLEKQGLSLASSISLVEDARLRLTQIHGEHGMSIKTKIENVLNKNKGYQLLIKISNILSGDEENFDGLPEDMNINDLIYFKYAPITSVDVERSFSVYKNMMTDNRRAFKFENIRKCLTIQCNNFNGKITKKLTKNNTYINVFFVLCYR